MNTQSESNSSFSVYILGALGAFLIVGCLAWFLWYRTQPAILNQARIEERLKNLREINAASAEGLNNYGWQDQSKGIIRLPISNAMEMVVREWSNPAAARSNLLARVDRANPAPPPKAPEKPSAFE